MPGADDATRLRIAREAIGRHSGFGKQVECLVDQLFTVANARRVMGQGARR